MMFAPEMLHGLTVTHLEAIRGYTTTLMAITNAYLSAKAIEPGGSLYSGRLARATLADAETAARGDDAYADGVRFALALPMVAERVTEIRAALASIRHDPGTDPPKETR